MNLTRCKMKKRADEMEIWGLRWTPQRCSRRTSNVNHWHAQMNIKEIPDGKLHLGKKQHLQHLQGLLWCLVFAVASGALFHIFMTDLQI